MINNARASLGVMEPMFHSMQLRLMAGTEGKNKINGYKIPKLRFELELDEEIMKQVAILCGTDANKVKNSVTTLKVSTPAICNPDRMSFGFSIQ